MAEEVIIQGFGNGNEMPDFATEATLKGLKTALSQGLKDVSGSVVAGSAKGLKPADIDKLANAISKGDTDAVKAFRDLIKTDDKNTKKTSDKLDKQLAELKELKEENKKGNTVAAQNAQEMQKSMDAFKGILGELKTGLEDGSISLSEAGNSLMDGLSTALGGLSSKVNLAAGAITTIASAINGANQFFMQIGEDRYDLANEIRQSGLATSLTNAQSGLVGFAEMVNKSSFTLGQAAEFASKFSAAVGDAGIERSLQFVEDMAYGGAEGADMMRRFGLEFGGVANVAGQYLDTVRNLGMLDRMSNQQLRGGMEDFMDTVTVTSNVMKVNIQDAAEMIANTLNQRDDLTAMLATMPDDMRTQLSAVVGSMGAAGTVVEEALAIRLGSGNDERFRATDFGQELAGSLFGQDLLPIIDAMASQIEAGGDLGQIVAGSTTALEELFNTAQQSGRSEEIIYGGDQIGIKLIAELSRTLGRREDAASGNQADLNREGLEDDRAFSDRRTVQQEFSLALENMTTSLAKQANYAQNLSELNEANLRLINEVETVAIQGINAFGDEVADVTFNVQEWTTEIGAAVTSMAGEIMGFVSDDMAESRRIVQEQNARAREMLGLPAQVPTAAETEEIRRREEEMQAARDEYDRIQMQRSYASGMRGRDVPEEYRVQVDFDEENARNRLELLSYIEGEQVTITDPNVQIDSLNPTLYMELPQSFVDEWNSEVERLNGNNALLQSFLDRQAQASDRELPTIEVTTPQDTRNIELDSLGNTFEDLLRLYIDTGSREQFLTTQAGQGLLSTTEGQEILSQLDTLSQDILSDVRQTANATGFSKMVIAQTDPELLRQFDAYQAEMQQTLIDEAREESGTEPTQIDIDFAEMKALNITLARFADEINSIEGAGEVTITGTEGLENLDERISQALNQVELPLPRIEAPNNNEIASMVSTISSQIDTSGDINDMASDISSFMVSQLGAIDPTLDIDGFKLRDDIVTAISQMPSDELNEDTMFNAISSALSEQDPYSDINFEEFRPNLDPVVSEIANLIEPVRDVEQLRNNSFSVAQGIISLLFDLVLFN